LWVTPELADDPNLHLLSDPDLLFARPECQVIKDQKKIKVGRIRLALGSAVRGLYLKRYNVFSWRYRIGSLLMPSGGSRSWVGAGVLLSAGFNTGRPLAAVECRSAGMLTKSFYLSEEIPGSKTVDLYWREELVPLDGLAGFHPRRAFLRALAGLFRSLHQRNIYHDDLKDANILVSSDEKAGREIFYLLDLEGIRTYRYLNRRRRIKNLVQLNRTLGRFLHGSQKLYWLKEYLGESFEDRQERKKWIRNILLESRRRDQRSLKKSRA
jgi:serine/threonine protein kinase